MSADNSDDEEIEIEKHTRKKKGRKAIPEELVTKVVEHDIPESEKQCGCGETLTRIGDESSIKIDIIPQKVDVIKNIYYKYACKCCEGVETPGKTVKIAPVAPTILGTCMATAGLLAYIVVSKFCDALPLYRQEKIFERFGLPISRVNMANWLIKGSKKLNPLLIYLQMELRSGPSMNIDETRVQVFREPGRKNSSFSQMWVYRGGAPCSPVILFDYKPTRSGKEPLEVVGDYKGYIQADDFSAYKVFEKNEHIILLGCWAHCRRKFDEVLKAAKNKEKIKTGKAEKALSYIRKLYAIEKRCRENDLTFDQIKTERQKYSKPILVEFKKWLDEKSLTVVPDGKLGKAIGYTLKNWPKLIGYVEEGYLSIDNNPAENAIRPFVLGRKNWMFSGSPRGADASALYYSLIETAKVNNYDPYYYLRYIFEQIPLIKDGKEYKNLLPQYLDREKFNKFKASL